MLKQRLQGQSQFPNAGQVRKFHFSYYSCRPWLLYLLDVFSNLFSSRNASF